jgi:hypothetical protein
MIEIKGTFPQYRCIQLEKELKRQKEDHETELRTSKNKYEASIDFLKQEHSLASAKVIVRQFCYLHFWIILASAFI